MDEIKSFSDDGESPAGIPLCPEPASLRDLRNGFGDDHQRRLVQALVRDRIADDGAQDECRYLMRFCWQLAMTYTEVSMPELRAHLTGAKLAVIEELIWAIRQSPAEVDRWMHAVEAEWPVIQDRSFQSREADT